MARKKKTSGDPKKPTGRPTKFDAEKVNAIFARFEDGERLSPLCREFEIPIGTFLGWVHDDREGLSERYSRAQSINALAMADETFDIADDGTNDWVERTRKDGSTFIALNDEHVRRSTLRVSARQWYIEKVLNGTIRMRRDKVDDTSTNVAHSALDILERLAMDKAASAKTLSVRA